MSGNNKELIATEQNGGPKDGSYDTVHEHQCTGWMISLSMGLYTRSFEMH